MHHIPNYDHSSATVPGAGRGRSFRQTVCRHWLRGLCMKAEACGFLHQYDKARMPICRFFRLHGECREHDCVYKHTNEDIKECNMYKLGFCPNGSECRYRHAKLPGPPPPVEEVLQKIQQLTSYNHGPNRFYQPRKVAPQLGDTQGQLQDSGNLQQQQPQQTQHQVSQTQTPNPAEQTSHAHPLPRGGCAKMTSRIGGENWKHEHGTAQFGRNFSVKWLKLCELSFHKTRNLRNPYNENLPVKVLYISRDCQELEPSVGEELASLLYLEPDSELMAISIAAEAKREEEKAKGVNPESRAENSNIVPFEDNEEEEEEEDDSEEEEDGMANGPQGRGRGMMWPPQMPLGRGIRPMPGMGGFPLGVMAPADAFPYGPGGCNGMPDPFGMGGPRPFGPYEPRFGGDFRGPVPRMMFPGRPPQQFPHGGYRMMGRGPVMGGMGNAAPRGGGGGRPMYHPPATTTTSVRPASSNRRTPERSDDRGVAVDEHTSHEMEQSEGGNSLRNEESGSEDEDEAPRRSRHGEGKKRR
ncbi:unnamed protein product [Brassica rapa]|uniref:Uncharacterized protein n=1 Tax=Brassica campestris TaxID=3711 RepID=A0A8D9M7C4_BRACM|nr:unnamed protein product [Brassica rapa]